MRSGFKTTVIILSIILIIVIPVSVEYATSRPAFCGSCHIMKKYFTTWESSKHRSVACVDCHYAPGEQHSLKAKFKGLSQLFSYLSAGGEGVRKRAYIDDASCITSRCHPPGGEHASKKIALDGGVSYVHNTHFDKTIEGQKLHCATCHQHSSMKKHFEVSREICYLCHFKNVAFNKGRGRCELCHEITDKPLQKQFDTVSTDSTTKMITHKSLQIADVKCQSCHIELIRGDGKIKKEDCLNCHEIGEDLEKAGDRKLMHEKHVAGQEADCQNCHAPITHKEIDDILELVRSECASCHPDHHLYQKTLLTGEAVDHIQKTPALMTEVKTNCLACHTEEVLDEKGQKLMRGSPGACVACHTKDHDQMLEDWKQSVKKELDEARIIGKEAATALEKSRGRLVVEDFEKYSNMINNGKHYLDIVEFGHGAHNKKYSIKLIDEALNNFEDILDELEEAT